MRTVRNSSTGRGDYFRLPICGNLSRRDFQRFRSGQFLNAVDMQENQCGHDSYPLISVYERMVLSDVKVIGGGHGSEVPM